MRNFQSIVTIVTSSLLSVSLVLTSTVKCYAETTTVAERNAIANNWKYVRQGTEKYNCLSFALGITDTWTWPWGGTEPDIDTVNYYLSSKHYIVSTNPHLLDYAPDKRKIVAYQKNKKVTHFSKASKNKNIKAKWGRAELFAGNKLASYTDYLYGQPCLYAYKYK